MPKIDVFQTFTDTEYKRMQVVYLSAYGFTPQEITKWTDYTVSTIKTYIRKFEDLLDKAKKIFYHITLKKKQTLKGGRQYVYLFKFYDKLGHLICSKIGTTTRLPEQRIKEEIKYYCKHGLAVENGEICSVIDCGDIPAEGAESEVRAKFIKKYPAAFHKNDRFFDISIPVVTFNKMVAEYLAN